MRWLIGSCCAIVFFSSLASAASQPGAAASSNGYRLFAHRGGVVEPTIPDNSLAALQAGLDRGYSLFEVDIRESKDGVAVLHHDRDLRARYGDRRRVEDLEWRELEQLRSTSSNERLLRLDDLLAETGGQLFLMLDIKRPHSAAFPAKLEEILRRHGMLEQCYIIGSSAARRHFRGKVAVGGPFRAVWWASKSGATRRGEVFLFDRGNRLTPRRVNWAQKRGIKIVATVNEFHYQGPLSKRRAVPSRNVLARAGRDIERLKSSGVHEFQIDSQFDQFFQDGNPGTSKSPAASPPAPSSRS